MINNSPFRGKLIQVHDEPRLNPKQPGFAIVEEETLNDSSLKTGICHSDMDFNVTEIKQSPSLFQLPTLLKLRKIVIDLTNQ